MKTFKLEDAWRGWFIGNFDPTVLKTEDFEVAYQTYEKGEQHEIHYHKIATEYNLVAQGTLIMNGQTFSKGDVFVMEPYMVSEMELLTDVEMVVVKVPSVPNDKYVINPGDDK